LIDYKGFCNWVNTEIKKKEALEHLKQEQAASESANTVSDIKLKLKYLKRDFS